MKRLDYIQSLGGLAIVVLVISLYGWIWLGYTIFWKLVLTCVLTIVLVSIAESKDKI